MEYCITRAPVETHTSISRGGKLHIERKPLQRGYAIAIAYMYVCTHCMMSTVYTWCYFDIVITQISYNRKVKAEVLFPILASRQTHLPHGHLRSLVCAFLSFCHVPLDCQLSAASLTDIWRAAMCYQLWVWLTRLRLEIIVLSFPLRLSLWRNSRSFASFSSFGVKQLYLVCVIKSQAEAKNSKLMLTSLALVYIRSQHKQNHKIVLNPA